MKWDEVMAHISSQIPLPNSCDVKNLSNKLNITGISYIIIAPCQCEPISYIKVLNCPMAANEQN